MTERCWICHITIAPSSCHILAMNLYVATPICNSMVSQSVRRHMLGTGMMDASGRDIWCWAGKELGGGGVVRVVLGVHPVARRIP